MLCYIIPKRRVDSKINQQVKKYFYSGFLQYPQVLQYPIANYCQKLSIDIQLEPLLVPNILWWVLLREIHNSMVSPAEEGGLKEERDSENISIIGDSTLRNILPPQLKNMTSRYKVICGCECCLSFKSMNFSLLIWVDSCLKQLKDISQNAQKRSAGEISSPIFETYNNAVRPRVCNIYNNAADMSMATMCPCTFKYHGLPHWKFLLHCCDKLPSIFLPSQDENKDTTRVQQ